MDPQPGVERQAFVVGPLDVIVNADEGILALLVWAHRRDQRFESLGLSDGAHGLDHPCAQALASILRMDIDLDGRLNIWFSSLFVNLDSFQKDPIPAAFWQLF